MINRKPTIDQTGFTIIELLIATLVFTLVLILLTTGTLAVSRLYYDGVISAQTQTAARNVVNTVTQALQFSGAGYTALSPSGNEKGFCIGSSQFSYQLQQTVTDATQSTPATHALLERNVGNSTSCALAGLNSMTNPSTTPPSTELLSAHMRLNNFDVTQVAGDPTLYCVSIRVIYGTDSIPGLLTPVSSTPTTDSCGGQYYQQNCNTAADSLTGSQFCAVSGLDTYVQERVAP